ncbi:3-deoxy-8-phosphooctulonate synthase [Pseudomonadota bacterium]
MQKQKNIKIGNFEIGNDKPFFLMAGPCQLESLDHTLMLAERLKKITDRLRINYVFKASYDKANRTSVSSKRGVGLDEGLKIFEKVKSELGLPVITDVHLPKECVPTSKVVDILQVPAFLCRQSDMLEVVAKTKKPIHVKKMQQLAPWTMESVVKKLEHFGNDKVMLCDRGTAFGYGTLVNDMRGLAVMAKNGTPVTVDVTHSIQHPGGKTTGGNRDMAQVIASAAVAVGVAGVFIEVHENPPSAPSDSANMIYLDKVEEILKRLVQLDRVAKANPIEIGNYDIIM